MTLNVCVWKAPESHTKHLESSLILPSNFLEYPETLLRPIETPLKSPWCLLTRSCNPIKTTETLPKLFKSPLKQWKLFKETTLLANRHLSFRWTLEGFKGISECFKKFWWFFMVSRTWTTSQMISRCFRRSFTGISGGFPGRFKGEPQTLLKGFKVAARMF